MFGPNEEEYDSDSFLAGDLSSEEMIEYADMIADLYCEENC